tara:strand:- start:1340 stop:2155 length:816 start_codon:yes stop_codon:yes gene_type:complete
MISEQSSKYFTTKNKNIYQNYKKNPNKFDYLDLIKKGILPRPHYALGLLLAAQQAKDLGYKSVKIIELGCYNFDGIIDLEYFTNDIKEFLDIDFEIFGFTMKEGLPQNNENSFDRLYRWSIGDYPLISKKNYNNIKFSEIYFGDIKNTIHKFKKDTIENLKISPIGFIIFDLDYYTSTKIALSLLNMKEDFYIPRPYLYFDDHSFSSKYEGERKAIMEFNKINNYKISDIYELAEQLSILWSKWLFLGKRFKTINYFNHEKYNNRVEQLLG